MCVVPGPASQVAVIKRVYASPALQCEEEMQKFRLHDMTPNNRLPSGLPSDMSFYQKHFVILYEDEMLPFILIPFNIFEWGKIREIQNIISVVLTSYYDTDEIFSTFLRHVLFTCFRIQL
jgi:hypothetical protein